MSLVQYNSGQDLLVQTVYYAGTNTLKEGSVVCYDNSDANAPTVDSWDPSVDPGPATLTTTGNRNLRGNRVIDPAAGLANLFAGVVASTSSGKVGPAFIDIVRPVRGQVFNVQANYSATKGDYVGQDTAGGTNNVIKITSPIASNAALFDTIGVILETKDLSGTAGTILVKAV